MFCGSPYVIFCQRVHRFALSSTLRRGRRHTETSVCIERVGYDDKCVWAAWLATLSTKACAFESRYGAPELAKDAAPAAGLVPKLLEARSPETERGAPPPVHFFGSPHCILGQRVHRFALSSTLCRSRRHTVTSVGIERVGYDDKCVWAPGSRLPAREHAPSSPAMGHASLRKTPHRPLDWCRSHRKHALRKLSGVPPPYVFFGSPYNIFGQRVHRFALSSTLRRSRRHAEPSVCIERVGYDDKCVWAPGSRLPAREHVPSSPAMGHASLRKTPHRPLDWCRSHWKHALRKLSGVRSEYHR